MLASAWGEACHPTGCRDFMIAWQCLEHCAGEKGDSLNTRVSASLPWSSLRESRARPLPSLGTATSQSLAGPTRTERVLLHSLL